MILYLSNALNCTGQTGTNSNGAFWKANTNIIKKHRNVLHKANKLKVVESARNKTKQLPTEVRVN